MDDIQEMAEDAVDLACSNNAELAQKAQPCSTLTKKLFGEEGYTKNTSIKLVQKYNIGEETASHLARTYGNRAFDVCELSLPTGKRWPRFGIPLRRLSIH